MDKKILQQYIEGTASREDVERVVDWLDQDEAHVREFMALHKLYDISLFSRPAEEGKSISIKNRSRTIWKRAAVELLKVAAIFLFFLFISQLFLNKPEEKKAPVAYQTLFVPPGQRAELLLPDSTKVWLNAKTRLVYPVQFGEGERTVTLDGEAYFDVKHNEDQAFVVKTDRMDVHVLGTEFNIIAYSEQPSTDITLLKGSVELKSAASGNSLFQSYRMNVNERVRLLDEKLTVSRINDLDYLKWREGLLCFNNETVESIIDKLQLYFDIQINVENKALLKFRYAGKFRTADGIEQVLKVLQLEHKFTYKRDNELNIITIK